MLEPTIVILGPPACGKDTITHVLTRLDSAYRLFPRLKVGGGRKEGYRLTTEESLNALIQSSQIIHVLERYGNSYAIDRPHLQKMFEQNLVPIVHCSAVRDYEELRRVLRPSLGILLWCTKGTCKTRLIQRGSSDIEARLEVWERVNTDIRMLPGDRANFDLITTTERVPPLATAALIYSAHQGSVPLSSVASLH
jgi:guanylate kinase